MIIESKGRHDGMIPCLPRIFQKALQTATIQSITRRQATEIDQRGVNIDQADGAFTNLIFRYAGGCFGPKWPCIGERSSR